MGEGLPPPVAGRPHAHQPRVQPVLDEAAQDAVLDHHRAARGRALVVDRQAAAAVGKGAVIDHGHAGRGDPLAQEPGEGGGLLAVEVALEPVADRLVQQDAGPAAAEHHLHLAGRRRHALEIDQRLAQRLVHRRAPARLARDLLVGEPPAGAVAAGLAPAIGLDHHRHVEPHQRAEIGDAGAVGAHDLHRLPLAGDARPSPASPAGPCRAHRRRSRRARLARSANSISRSGFASV